MSKITRFIHGQRLTLKRNSPHIFFGAGLIGVGVGTVLACRATLKLEPVLDEIKNDLGNVKEMKEAAQKSDRLGLVVDDQFNRDTAYVYGKAAKSVAKLYGPSVVVMGVSFASLTGAHVQLSRRNTALMAAYATVSAAYENYRQRVAEEIGKERELEIYRGVTGVEATEDGEIPVCEDGVWSEYAKVYDEASREFRKDPEYNHYFITCQQNYANDKLKARGHLFLNEVYEMLGFDHTQAGAVVGWIWNGDGDNYVDFGVYKAFNVNPEFMNGREPRVILDFNVDGIVYDKI